MTYISDALIFTSMVFIGTVSVLFIDLFAVIKGRKKIIALPLCHSKQFFS